jgi:hypothetical protein
MTLHHTPTRMVHPRQQPLLLPYFTLEAPRMTLLYDTKDRYHISKRILQVQVQVQVQVQGQADNNNTQVSLVHPDPVDNRLVVRYQVVNLFLLRKYLAVG